MCQARPSARNAWQDYIENNDTTSRRKCSNKLLIILLCLLLLIAIVVTLGVVLSKYVIKKPDYVFLETTTSSTYPSSSNTLGSTFYPETSTLEVPDNRAIASNTTSVVSTEITQTVTSSVSTLRPSTLPITDPTTSLSTTTTTITISTTTLSEQQQIQLAFNNSVQPFLDQGWFTTFNVNQKVLYKYIQINLKWKFARDYCPTVHTKARLITILNQEEADLAQIVSNNERTWLGGNDINEEGKWVWDDDGFGGRNGQWTQMV